MKNTAGFTLPELLAAVAVLGVLLMVAGQHYRVPIAKTVVSEAMIQLPGRQYQVREHYAVTGRWLADAGEAHGLGNHVDAMHVDEGAITAEFHLREAVRLGGRLLTFRPVTRSGDGMTLHWLCGYAEAPHGVVVQGQNRTDIPPGHLPALCKSTGGG